jgi:COP9 signalosome complex subunit 3
MASILEQFVTTVRTLSSHGNYKVLCEYLNKSSDILLKNTQHLDNVLETLDLQQHSLGYMVVLCAKFNTTTTANAQDNRFAQVQEFIQGCNGEQIRLAPDTCIMSIFKFWFYLC